MMMMVMMMMRMMMMWMCKRPAQVPMLCVPIYNMKLAMVQKTHIFTTFSAHTKMAVDKRGQIEVFARINIYIYHDLTYYYYINYYYMNYYYHYIYII